LVQKSLGSSPSGPTKKEYESAPFLFCN